MKQKKQNEQKKNSLLTVIAGILLVSAVVLVAALLVLRLMGVQFMAVKTGSMGEDYPVGSMVVVYGCEPEKVQTGDVITYIIDEKNSTYVTHRVIDIDTDEQCFVTQGDANNTVDKGSVAFSQIVGKVVCCIPRAGYPALWLGRSGKWILVGALAAFALVSCLSALFESKEDEER